MIPGAEDNNLSAAGVLRVIRDEPLVTYEHLQRQFDAFFGERNHLLFAIVHQLVGAGLVEWKGENRIVVTRSWMVIQNLLGLSLSADLDLEDEELSVKPFFGLPRRDSQFRADVFVLMPFSPSLRPVYDDHITKVVRSLGWVVKRADDFFGVRNIMEEIWSAIAAARVIIADCTGRNANVFYEIGIAHTIGRPVILITQAGDDVPFDLKSVRYILYEYTPRGMAMFEEKLASTLGEVLG